jgi:hypothetical protein
MNQSEYLKSIGKSNSFLAVIRAQNSLLYRYIRFIGKGDIVKGYAIYLDDLSKANNKAIDIAYKFDSESSFILWLVEKNICKNRQSAHKFLNSTIFSMATKRLKSYGKFKKIIKAYEVETISAAVI